jgi:hypothetical protein
MKKPSNNPVATAAENPVTPMAAAALEQIRANHLQANQETLDTINRLEAWRDELDATIAFLKARK